jgi:hypothetical protein
MASACSCRSAQACWRGCCCHTNREKLAWAEKHGVTPPSYVVAAAAKEKPAARGCCASKKPPQTAEAADSWRLTLIPSIAARKCQGLAELWLILSAAAPIAKPVTCQIELAVATATPLPTDNLLSYDAVPPTPPPRA